MAGGQLHRRRSAPRRSTFREIREDVERTVDPLVRFADLVPGDFGDEGQVVRHPSGELYDLAEEDITLDDARNIVRTGADLYVDPEDMGFWAEAHNWYGVEQWWVLGERADVLYEVESLIGKNRIPVRIDFFRSPEGKYLLHVTGSWDWPPSARTLTTAQWRGR